uniref:Uncharacterized protein n=1 Tax=Romanomermis culicivorax TaxID=13658 RepID=A0A915JAF0_ROMCU
MQVATVDVRLRRRGM